MEDGLSHQPGSRSLYHLKSSILAELRETGSDWASKAHAFWTQELTVEPMNFEARRQLARAEIAGGNTPAAWALVNECLPLFDFEASVSLQELRLGVEECLDALEFLPPYRQFRTSFSLAKIWEPKAAKDFKEETNLAAQDCLNAYLAVPFGFGYRQLKEGNEDLTAFFDSIRQPLIASFVAAGQAFAPAILTAKGNAKRMAKLTTSGASLLANASQYEFTHLTSWMPGVFQFEQEQVVVAFAAYDGIVVAVDVLKDSLIELARPYLRSEKAGEATVEPHQPRKRNAKKAAKKSKGRQV